MLAATKLLLALFADCCCRMPPTDREIKTLRLTAEQNRRLERAAESQGQTQQAFILAAVMRAIEDCETTREQSRDRRRRSERDHRSDEPMGLGLHRDKAKPAPAPETAQSQVVVNVGKQDAGSDDIVMRLADDVCDGPEFNREQRLHAAVETLRRLCRSDSEREEMARKLDAEVARRTKPAEKSFLSWDHLKDLLR